MSFWLLEEQFSVKVAQIWCSTAGVLWLNTLAELLGLSDLIFFLKMAPWVCHR
jgi:hypothetical protein